MCERRLFRPMCDRVEGDFEEATPQATPILETLLVPQLVTRSKRR